MWQKVVGFLSDPALFLAELEDRRQSTAGQKSEGRNKIAAEERKLAEVTRQESELVNLSLQDLVSQEALEQSAALLRARRTYHLEEIERQKAILATSEQAQAAVESLAALRTRIADRLDSATPEDRRRVLEALDTRITLSETKGLDISIGVPGRADYIHQTQGHPPACCLRSRMDRPRRPATRLEPRRRGSSWLRRSALIIEPHGASPKLRPGGQQRLE